MSLHPPPGAPGSSGSPGGLTDADPLRLDPSRVVLAVIDVQERMATSMDPDDLARTTRNIATLVEVARRLAIPLVVSEQYPRGLGPTVAALEEAIAAHGAAHRFDKVEFGLCDAPAFAAVDEALAGRDQWILAGMEAHICVFQTARELVRRARQVHVPEDAVLSRTRDNHRIGLHLMDRAGALRTSTETILFDLLRRAGTDDFRALSRLIR